MLKEEDIRVLGVGAIWNFVKEQDIRVLGVGAIWNFAKRTGHEGNRCGGHLELC